LKLFETRGNCFRAISALLLILGIEIFVFKIYGNAQLNWSNLPNITFNVKHTSKYQSFYQPEKSPYIFVK